MLHQVIFHRRKIMCPSLLVVLTPHPVSTILFRPPRLRRNERVGRDKFLGVWVLSYCNVVLLFVIPGYRSLRTGKNTAGHVTKGDYHNVAEWRASDRAGGEDRVACGGRAGWLGVWGRSVGIGVGVQGDQMDNQNFGREFIAVPPWGGCGARGGPMSCGGCRGSGGGGARETVVVLHRIC